MEEGDAVGVAEQAEEGTDPGPGVGVRTQRMVLADGEAVAVAVGEAVATVTDGGFQVLDIALEEVGTDTTALEVQVVTDVADAFVGIPSRPASWHPTSRTGAPSIESLSK